MTVKWEEMTDQQKRVEIAKDVIRQLDTGCTVAVHDSYWEWDKIHRKNDWEGGFNDYVKQPCQACAIGSVVVAAVRRGEGFKDFRGDETKGAKMFTSKQLRLMEAAFEGWSDYGLARWRGADRGSDLLRRIMQNVIDNDGEFVPYVVKVKL